jgi:hypothetical protein
LFTGSLNTKFFTAGKDLICVFLEKRILKSIAHVDVDVHSTNTTHMDAPGCSVVVVLPVKGLEKEIAER